MLAAAVLLCSSLPFAALSINYWTAKRGVALITYTRFDTAMFSQKLVLCMLLQSGLDEYGSVIVTVSHTVLVLLLWLRLRPHRHAQTRAIALTMFSCVAGLQVYLLVNATRYATASATKTASTWRFGFSASMFCYVVCCIVYCLTSVGWCAVQVVRGPVMTKRRQHSMHKSQLNHGVWVAELDAYSAGAVSRPRLSMRPASEQLSIRHRVASITSSAVNHPQAPTPAAEQD